MPTNHHRQFDLAIHMLKIEKRDKEISVLKNRENYKYMFTPDRKKNREI